MKLGNMSAPPGRLGLWNRTAARKLTLCALVFLSVGGVTALAHGDAKVDAIIKQRQDAMKKMGGTFKTVMPIIKGDSNDLSQAVTAAMTVNTVAKEIPSLFPKGTGREASDDTRAKPDVWSKRAEFEEAAEKLADESAKLAKAAEMNDLDGFKAQFKAYAAACGGCHEGPSKSGGKFRYKKN